MEISILSKKPWFRRMAEGTLPHPAMHLDSTSDNGAPAIIYSQKRMLDEYYPTSHDIYNKALYPDIIREVEEEGVDEMGNPTIVKRKYIEPLPRTAFAYQQIIETKRTDHLTGNDVTFERNWSNQDEQRDKLFQQLVDAWEAYDMEDAIYNLVHQSNIVADAAFVGYRYTDQFGEKKFSWNVFSYLNGDNIFYHCDDRSGRVKIFARQFTDAADNTMVEVWDDKYYYLFTCPREPSTVQPTASPTQSVHSHVQPSPSEPSSASSPATTRYIFTLFDPQTKTDRPTPYYLDGYTLVDKHPHGFIFCPVSVRRLKDGPVWVFSQDSIEAYEEDFNGLRHNNKTYGEPIMVFSGDDVSGVPETDGTVKYISTGKDDKVNLLQGQSAAESYMRGLEKTEDLIYLQSFIVKTPELKSGDLPAAALKILYSPAVEKAMHEVKDIQPVVNAIVDIFRWAIGTIEGNTIGYSPSQLPIKAYLKPFVHQSDSATVADIVASVNGGVLSHRTGAERLSNYLAEENEWNRIVQEQKDQQSADLLYETALSQATQSPDPQSPAPQD